MPSFLLKIVLHYVMAALEKLESEINWEELEEKLDDHIRAIFPVKMVSTSVIHFAHIALAALRDILSKHDLLKDVLVLVAEEKFTEAASKLEDLVKDEFPATWEA